jgi:hypothetical protein
MTPKPVVEPVSPAVELLLVIPNKITNQNKAKISSA